MSKNRTKVRAAHAAQLFFLIQPIKSFFSGVIVAVAVVFAYSKLSNDKVITPFVVHSCKATRRGKYVFLTNIETQSVWSGILDSIAWLPSLKQVHVGLNVCKIEESNKLWMTDVVGYLTSGAFLLEKIMTEVACKGFA